MWKEIRTALDYPVFTAAPENVGITATGAEGPSDLPKVLEAWKTFAQWVRTGADEGQKPVFPV